MSAFVVSNKTLQRVASIVANVCNDNEPAISAEAAKEIKKAFAKCKGDVFKIAARLYEANVESVNYRYDKNSNTKLSKNEFGTVEPSQFILEANREQSTYQAYASVCCWIYQSCERPDCDENPYYHAMSVLSKGLERYIGASSSKIRYHEQWDHIVWDE